MEQDQGTRDSDGKEESSQEEKDCLSNKSADVTQDKRMLVADMGDGEPAVDVTKTGDTGDHAVEKSEVDETEGLRSAAKTVYKRIKERLTGSQKKSNEQETCISLQSTNQSQINPKSPGEDPDVYDFTHKKRGLAVIINNEKFHPQSGYQSRPGSHCDAEALKKMFKKLQFDVKLHNNLNASEIETTLQRDEISEVFSPALSVYCPLLKSEMKKNWRGQTIILKIQVFDRMDYPEQSSYDKLWERKLDHGIVKMCYKDQKKTSTFADACEPPEIEERGFRIEAASYDHKNADCLAVAILSHGDSLVQKKSGSYFKPKSKQHVIKEKQDLIFGVDGYCIPTATIIQIFQDDRFEDLRGKPRFFFMQACRGNKYDEGTNIIVVSDTAAAEESDEDDNGYLEETDGGRTPGCVATPSPIFKDFLVVYATAPGHFAWRRSTGSWFIQSLYTVFTQHLTPHMSLTQALTRVIRMVAHGFESRHVEVKFKGKKQTPVIDSMLIKDVYFTPK